MLCTLHQAVSQEIVVSSYYNATEPRDEWTELVVINDNLNLSNYTIRDNNSSQSSWQTAITFRNVPLWRNMRAGTVIILHHRPCNSSGVSHQEDTNKNDGFLILNLRNTTYFSGGNFPTNACTTNGGNSMNIAGSGDIVEIRNASGTHVHGLGHKSSTGSSFNSMSNPKLNNPGTASSNQIILVCPGDSLTRYGGGSSSSLTDRSSSISFGLPNTCSGSSTANSLYWRKLRQPTWIDPTLQATMDTSTYKPVLNWNKASDLNSTDNTVGYIILRHTNSSIGTPSDGITYTVGQTVTGGAVVVANITSSQTSTFTDNQTLQCNVPYYYKVFAYRYTTDNINGNTYDAARGRAYNETGTNTVQIQRTKPNTSSIFHF